MRKKQLTHSLPQSETCHSNVSDSTIKNLNNLLYTLLQEANLISEGRRCSAQGIFSYFKMGNIFEGVLLAKEVTRVELELGKVPQAEHISYK